MSYTWIYTIKTASNILDHLYQAVIEHVAGKKFSTTVCDLIRQALYGNHDNGEVIPKVSLSITSEFSSMLQELTNRIVTLEVSIKVHGMNEEHEMMSVIETG